MTTCQPGELKMCQANQTVAHAKSDCCSDNMLMTLKVPFVLLLLTQGMMQLPVVVTLPLCCISS